MPTDYDSSSSEEWLSEDEDEFADEDALFKKYGHVEPEVLEEEKSEEKRDEPNGEARIEPLLVPLSSHKIADIEKILEEEDA
mmetsp:Transcript_9303/g.12294  ORF Transcript_9303/g.12294 Transcript_9303/m.12294 type:complete len:82 (-) Transcript_9303:37-282(-)